MNESTPIYNSVELIPLEQNEISPLISKVKIKVFHLGANRNGSYIDKDTALQMAKSLRGNPIVGAYKEEKQDFSDHGQKVTIEEGQIKIECLTKPYGFVDLNAEAWFENYIDVDEFGNKVEHTYLITEGIIWRGQFPELEETIFDSLGEGRPQSMELDEKTLKGNWSKDYNNGLDIFIISEALISKLCILGEDTEPCFLGSSVTPVDTEINFSLSKDFTKEMYSMMQELKELLKGEQKMNNENTVVSENAEVDTNFENSQDNIVEEVVSENDNNVESISENVETSLEEPVVEFTESEESVEVEAEAEVVEETVEVEPTNAEVEEPAAEFVKAEDEEEKKEEEKSDSEEEAKSEDNKEDEEDKKKYSLLEEEYNTLKAQFTELETKYNELLSFKSEVEDKEKDALISSFSMLTEEEMKEVVENKSKYTLDEIESKLSVMFTRKQRAAAAEVVEEPAEEVVEVPTIFNVQEDLSNVPDWVKAVKETEKNL